MERVRNRLSRRGTMTTGEIKECIEEEFNVSYTTKQVAVRTHAIEAKFAKPYAWDSHSLDDTDEVLEKPSRALESLSRKDRCNAVIDVLDKSTRQIQKDTVRL